MLFLLQFLCFALYMSMILLLLAGLFAEPENPPYRRLEKKYIRSAKS